MSALEEARELFEASLDKYSTQNLIQLMQISDVNHPGHKLFKALNEIEHSKMIYEVCNKELNKRLEIKER